MQNIFWITEACSLTLRKSCWQVMQFYLKFSQRTVWYNMASNAKHFNLIITSSSNWNLTHQIVPFALISTRKLKKKTRVENFGFCTYYSPIPIPIFQNFPGKNLRKFHQKISEWFFENLISLIFSKWISKLTSSGNCILF